MSGEIISMSSPELETIMDNDMCTSVQISWKTANAENFYEQPVVRYTYNKNATVGKYSLKHYDDYVEKTHMDLTGSDPDWGGWDHWLDQHIGLK